VSNKATACAVFLLSPTAEAANNDASHKHAQPRVDPPACLKYQATETHLNDIENKRFLRYRGYPLLPLWPFPEFSFYDVVETVQFVHGLAGMGTFERGVILLCGHQHISSIGFMRCNVPNVVGEIFESRDCSLG
jgi:hypothetical protein